MPTRRWHGISDPRLAGHSAFPCMVIERADGQAPSPLPPVAVAGIVAVVVVAFVVASLLLVPVPSSLLSSSMKAA